MDGLWTGGHLVFELLYCLQITAKEDPDSGGIWLWLILPMTLALALACGTLAFAVALAWICLGPTSPNWVNVCPGGGGTVPKGGPAWGLEVLVEVSQSSCFKFQIAKV